MKSILLWPEIMDGFYDDLYNTIVKKEPLKVKPEHGFNTIRLIELATESSQKKCRIRMYEFDGCPLSLNDQQAATANITIIHSA